jgi:hypothetical protein
MSRPTGIVLAALILAASVVSMQFSSGLRANAPETVRWEYSTSSVESGSLQTHLSDLSVQGWEVFSIVQHEQLVEGTSEGKPRLQVQSYQVTAKRVTK